MEKYRVEAWDYIDHHWYPINKENWCVGSTPSKEDCFLYLEEMKQDGIFKHKMMRVIQVIEQYIP